MTLDIANNPVIAYLTIPGLAREWLIATTRLCDCASLNDAADAASWATPIDTSIAIDPATDFPVVSYIDDSDTIDVGRLHASRPLPTNRVLTSLSWRHRIASSISRRNTSLVLDINGNPTISRFDATLSQADGDPLHRPAVHPAHPGARASCLTRTRSPPTAIM